MSRVPLSKKAVELLYHPEHATAFAEKVLTVNFWDRKKGETAGKKEIELVSESGTVKYTLSSISINLACANGKVHESIKGTHKSGEK